MRATTAVRQAVGRRAIAWQSLPGFLHRGRRAAAPRTTGRPVRAAPRAPTSPPSPVTCPSAAYPRGPAPVVDARPRAGRNGVNDDLIRLQIIRPAFVGVDGRSFLAPR